MAQEDQKKNKIKKVWNEPGWVVLYAMNGTIFKFFPDSEGRGLEKAIKFAEDREFSIPTAFHVDSFVEFE